MDCPQKIGCSFTVTGCNRGILLKFSKEVFDQMTGFVNVFIVKNGCSPVLLRGGDDGLNSLVFKLFSHTFIRIIGLVS